MLPHACLVVTEHIDTSNGRDISDDLQRLILDNPNRTLYFPDGEYVLAKPILTPADPKKSVSLKLADFAILRAAEDWDSDEAMIRLGGCEPANNIYVPGSNYGIEGGVLDCGEVAKGISIDGGRETYIRQVSIKRALVGIHIKYGANSGSSDADIHSVNITGNGAVDSIGVLLEGYDNTLTNLRIANVMVGVKVMSGGNMLRNIHPLLIRNTPAYQHYDETVGFLDTYGKNNWYDYCYSDQFSVGFHTVSGGTFHDCFCFWYSKDERKHVALQSDTPFSGFVTNFTVGGARHPDSDNYLLYRTELSEQGSLSNVRVNDRFLSPDEILQSVYLGEG